MKTIPVRIVGLLILIVLSRMALYAIGLAPNPDHTAGNWQTLSLTSLDSDLFQAIWNLHSQPPLWNILAGTASKLCDADLSCVVWSGYFVNVALTWLSACLILQLLLNFRLAKPIAWIVALIFIFSPSTVYYEFYIFYAHPSLALMLGLIFCLHRFGTMNSQVALGVAFILAVFLCWIWSLFHPMFIIVVFGCAVLSNARIALKRQNLVMGALALSCALAPSIKNQMNFGMFMNGSWVGLNLAGVVRSVDPEFEPTCDFISFLKTQRVSGEIHPGTTLNSPDIVPLSKYCFEASKSAILSNPKAIVMDRLDALRMRHSMMPHDYFLPPTNWDLIPDLPFGRNGSFNNSNTAPSVKIFERFTLGFYVFAWLSLVKIAVTHQDLQTRRFFGSLLLIALWFTAVAFAFNRAEQQRMRHTIEPFFLISASLVFGQIITWIGSRRPFVTLRSK